MSAQRQNLNSIYVLLFLNVAFYLLEHADPQKYGYLFAFDRNKVLSGEVWRLITFQFVHSSAIGLFFDLIILYIMGTAVEEALGTSGFLTLFAVSALGSAGVAFALDLTLLSSVFFSASLLFVYAHMFPEQVFYIFFFIPVKVKWIAIVVLGFTLFGVVARNPQSLATLGGSATAFGCYMLLTRRRIRPAILRPALPEREEVPNDAAADRNLARFREINAALDQGVAVDPKLVATLQKEVVANVNICPPADYKPAKEDRYCIRCEGFAECSLRYIGLKQVKPAAAETNPTPQHS